MKSFPLSVMITVSRWYGMMSKTALQEPILQSPSYIKNALWESVMIQTAVSLTRKRAFVKDLDQE